MLRREYVQMVSYMRVYVGQHEVSLKHQRKGNEPCQCSFILIEMSMGSASSQEGRKKYCVSLFCLCIMTSYSQVIFFFYIQTHKDYSKQFLQKIHFMDQIAEFKINFKKMLLVNYSYVWVLIKTLIFTLKYFLQQLWHQLPCRTHFMKSYKEN